MRKLVPAFFAVIGLALAGMTGTATAGCMTKHVVHKVHRVHHRHHVAQPAPPQETGCPEIPQEKVDIPPPPPKIVTVPQRIIVRYQPQIEYAPAPQVNVLPINCPPVATIAPPPCAQNTCSAAIPPGIDAKVPTQLGELPGGVTRWAWNGIAWRLPPKTRPSQHVCEYGGVLGWCG